jgi:plastocyanin
MRGYRNGLGILVAAILVASAPVWAHEECDEIELLEKPIADRPPQALAGSHVTIKLFQFQPGRIQVNTGTTVTWINDDEIFHTVTMMKKDGGFDAPLDGKGKSFSFTFKQPGIYSYYCDRHEHMRGEIEVVR